MFGAISSSYEECRAECVAMDLSCDFEILRIFGFGDGTENMGNKAGEVLYASYLSMARAGIAALEFWDPNSRKWGQAHMQARYSILKAFLKPDGFVKLDCTEDEHGISGLTLKLDKSKILTDGRSAVREYLQKLHIYKCTADIQEGKKLYGDMTSVDEWFGSKVRAEVMRKKILRKVFVQCNTVEENGKVRLEEYPPTLEGMIQSFAERNV